MRLSIVERVDTHTHRHKASCHTCHRAKAQLQQWEHVDSVVIDIRAVSTPMPMVAPETITRHSWSPTDRRLDTYFHLVAPTTFHSGTTRKSWGFPGLVKISGPRWQGLVSRSNALHGTAAGMPQHIDRHMSTAAHTSSKWVWGPLPERDYALNTHRKIGALAAIARALPMRLVCSWRRLLWFVDHSDSDCWVAQTNGRAGSAVATCIDTTKAGWHTR
eukprot:scaffold2788_cov137-Isochrysis_galbana.AAC.2